MALSVDVRRHVERDRSGPPDLLPILNFDTERHFEHIAAYFFVCVCINHMACYVAIVDAQ